MAQLTYQELNKLAKKQPKDGKPYRLAILGDCATQHLATAIKGTAYNEELPFQIYDSDYNLIDAQIVDTESELYRFHPDFILIDMCCEKLYDAFCNVELDQREQFAETVYRKIETYWRLLGQNIKANILQFTFTYKNDFTFGNFALKTRQSFPSQLHKLNELLNDGSRLFKNVYLVDLSAIQTSMGDVFFDPKLYYIAKVPYSMSALPRIAQSVLDVIKAINGQIKKCVILDLDNTLWGGVIGDDGLGGIEIGDLGQGHAFSSFQLWLKELKNRGILLAVCSKNNEDTAKEPFLKHPDMILKLSDFSLFVANWEDKATNIKHIQKTLNIGMDSMVFIDDNAFERNLVRSIIPEIVVPELPNDPALYLDFLQKLNLFEIASFSEEDIKRTEQYRAEAGRAKLQQQFATFDAYLQSLSMEATVAPFDPFHYARISQLTQRSNQFNLRTIRYTEAEISSIAQDDRYITEYFSLKDKFGDHGLISVVILEKQTDSTLFVNEWLMSCRVLKRGMEEFIINKLIEVARENGYTKIIGEYLPTPKNAMVAEIYAKLGFEPKGNGLFEVQVSEFKENNTYIKEFAK